ncbi:hypothetical protein Tco_0569486 [Tanacetum coccineum]
MSGEEPAAQIALVESSIMVSTIKLPILKKVILNGDGPIQVTTDEKDVETEVPPKTAQALLARQRERKAKSIMLLAIPDEYQLRFHAIKDAKTMWAAIKSTFGGNVESKKMQNNNDTTANNEVKTLKVPLDDEDLEQIDHDDLEEMDLKWQVAMLSMRVKKIFKNILEETLRNQGNGNRDAGFRSRDNTRRTVPVETSDALAIQDNTLIVQDGLGYDWSYITQDKPTEFALMAYTANSSRSDTEKNEVVYEEKIAVLESEVKDKSNAVTRLKNQLDEILREKDDLKAKLEQFETSSKNLNKLINSQLSSKDKTGLGYGDHLNENDSSGSELYNSIFDSRSSDGDDNQTNDRFKKDNGYHVVPSPLTGNYMPPLADLSFAGLDDSVYRPTTNKTSANVSQVEASATPPSNTSVEMPRVESVRPSGVIIEDWVSDDEDIFQSNDLQATDKPSLKKIDPIKGNPQQALKNQGIFDSGCSRHMIGNKDFLTDYQELDGGFIAFGRSARGVKITGKGKIKTDKLDFKDVFFVKELKFNLFDVSQNEYKKNSVLFTETESTELRWKHDTAADSLVNLLSQEPQVMNEQANEECIYANMMDQEKEGYKAIRIC